MRTTTLPSMLEILTRNYNYRNQDVKLYEVGRVYLPGGPDGLAVEKKVLTLGAYGADMDFYAMKGVIEEVLQELRVKDASFRVGSGLPEEASYHPGRYAEVWSGGERLGRFGQIHPLTARNFGVDAAFYCAELSMEALEKVKGSDPEYVPLPKFPRRHPGHRRGVRRKGHCGRPGGLHPPGSQGPAEGCGPVRHLHRRRHPGGEEIRGLQPDPAGR